MSTMFARVLIAVIVSCTAASAWADPVLVGRVTHPVTDAQANGEVNSPALSGSGRYLFFTSTASNLGTAFNGGLNLYRYDLSGISQPMDSLLLATSVLSGNHFVPAASLDGERFTYETLANNLGGTPGPFTDIYVGQSIVLSGNAVGFEQFLVSRGLGNTAQNGEARSPSISGNGQWVAFFSDSTNLVSGDVNNQPDIFLANVADLGAAPERISVDSNEVPFTGRSFFLSNKAVSHDARYVVFTARAPTGVTTNISDIFLRDRTAGTTTLISRLSNGTPFNNASDQAALSSNGRYIVFRSFATNGPGATGSRVWIYDTQANQMTSVPLPPAISTCEDPRVSNSADIIIQCNSSVAGVPAQAFLYRFANGSMFRLSSTPGNGNGNGTSGTFMDMSADGSFIAYDSAADNLVPGDTNSVTDVFLTIDSEVLFNIFRDGFE